MRIMQGVERAEFISNTEETKDGHRLTLKDASFRPIVWIDVVPAEGEVSVILLSKKSPVEFMAVVEEQFGTRKVVWRPGGLALFGTADGVTFSLETGVPTIGNVAHASVIVKLSAGNRDQTLSKIASVASKIIIDPSLDPVFLGTSLRDFVSAHPV